VNRYHTPVLSTELVAGLSPGNPRVVVDATLGGGGHAFALLSALPPGSLLIGIDQDEDALASAAASLAAFAGQVRLLRGNFREVESILLSAGLTRVDAIYADLGLSSHQIDDPSRGFSYLLDGPLDMRMDQRHPHTAADLVQRLTARELADLFWRYGEERHSRKIAARIEHARMHQSLARTTDLAKLVESLVPPPARMKTLARVFQALRIAVNDELNALGEFLAAALRVLAPSGKLGVISYHSLEDRQVKNFFRDKAKSCTCPPELPVCTCGRESELVVLTKKAIKPSARETAQNPRSRSARLRIAQTRASR